MVAWYVRLRHLLQNIESKSRDALLLYDQGGKDASASVNRYLKSDYKELEEHWKEQFSTPVPSYLGRHICFGLDSDYRDILAHDLRDIEAIAEKKLLDLGSHRGSFGFEHLLHPLVKESAYQQFLNGHLREAVLNSVIALFDHLRKITGLDLDGEDLVSRALSPGKPYLILSNLQTDSGQNDQKGFMQVFKGFYQGVRNPKAHSLTHDLNAHKAAQYLVCMSLLARRLDEAKVTQKHS